MWYINIITYFFENNDDFLTFNRKDKYEENLDNNHNIFMSKIQIIAVNKRYFKSIESLDN